MNYYKYKLLEQIILLFITLSLSLTSIPIKLRAEDNVSFVKTISSEVARLSKKYNVNETLVRKIIKCESKGFSNIVNNNINKKGEVWSKDFGSMQINDYFHLDTMKKLGLDYYDEYDSLEYGIMLLAKEGTKPWNASKSCWNN